MKSINIFFLSALILSLSSCIKKESVYNLPAEEFDNRYELAWIDPVMLETDSLITLIRSDRIDSIIVTRQTGNQPVIQSLTFKIEDENCPVAINLRDGAGRLLYPLYFNNLAKGFYKVTLLTERFSNPPRHSDVYYLGAEFCDEVVVEKIYFD